MALIFKRFKQYFSVLCLASEWRLCMYQCTCNNYTAHICDLLLYTDYSKNTVPIQL